MAMLADEDAPSGLGRPRRGASQPHRTVRIWALPTKRSRPIAPSGTWIHQGVADRAGAHGDYLPVIDPAKVRLDDPGWTAPSAQITQAD